MRSSWRRAAGTDGEPLHREHAGRAARDAPHDRRLLDRGPARQDPAEGPAVAAADAAAGPGGGRPRAAHAGGGRQERRRRSLRLLPGRWLVRPLRAEPDQPPDLARRVLHRVHAVPAGGEPGNAAHDLRIPDHDRRADRHGRRQRLDLRRGQLARRGRAHGALRDGAHGDRAGARREPALSPRRRDLLRWPEPRRLCRQERAGAAHARPPRRRHRRQGRAARLRADAADTRAAHPAREGDVEHLHERRALRADGHHLSLDHRQAGTAAGGRAVGGQGPLPRRAADQGARRLAPLAPPVLQGVHPHAAEVAGEHRGEAGEEAHSAGGAHQGLRQDARRLPVGGGDRAAHARGDRRLRGRAGGGARVSAYDKLVFELSSPGRVGFSLPESDVPGRPMAGLLPKKFLRGAAPALPEVSEFDVVRHYSRLSRMNYGLDTHFYPLGSCTMKYNPRINEDMARVPGFARLHPLTRPEDAQGALRLMHDLAGMLAEIAGMDTVSLQPAAGAQGEVAGVLMIRAYHASRGERRTKVLIPDSAHGTNPASTALAGYEVVEVKSLPNGEVDLDALAREVGPDAAAFMITVPNTLGMFEPRILDITEICHAKGVQVYMDGANLNAILGITRPGDLGFDVCHFNLHKTFTTPHGGGGPRAGPVRVQAHPQPLLPAA